MCGFSLNYEIVFMLKIIIYLSGIFLFFFYLKPFKKVAIYYFYYFLTALSAILFWLSKSFIFGLLTAILIFPIYRNTIQYKSKNLIVHDIYQGFMSECCLYELTEPKLLLFEKKVGKVYIWQNIDFKKSILTIDNKTLKIENDSIIKIEISN